MDTDMKECYMHRMHFLVVALVATCVACVQVVRAQDATSVVVGARLRVTSLSMPTERGEFGALRGDSLMYIAHDGSRRTVALQDITLLELACGMRTRAGEVALGGALLGAVVGAVLGSQAIEHQQATATGFPQLGSTNAGGFAGALVGSLGGGVVGAVIGRYFRTDRWENVRWVADSALPGCPIR